MRHRTIALLALAGTTMILVAGCGSKVSKDNFDKIKNGMTVAEVEEILGKATEEGEAGGAVGELVGAGKVMTWKDGDKSIGVTFVNGKVTAKVQTGL